MFKLEHEQILERFGKMLWTLRRLPAHAVNWLSGVYLPPHERIWLSLMFADYRENNVIGSRGTSKSFGLASLGTPIYDTLHKASTSLVVSASGFRGGKLLFEDIDRLYKGKLRSQYLEGEYLLLNVDKETKNKVLTRHPDMWFIDHKSNSRTLTVPTNNPEAMRGIRATTVVVDERNTFDGEVVQTVIRPMMNVGKEFRKTAAGLGKNKIFQVSTIDYTFRDWHPEIQAQVALARRQYEAANALKNQDYDSYVDLMEADEGALKNASFSVTRVDYTDLIIPTEVQAITEDKIYEVHLPLERGITPEDVRRYDPRDGVDYWYLYPVDKDGLEAPLRDGTMDEDLWLAEQRNVFISASGNVYPHELIVKASDRPIYKKGKFPPGVTYDDDFYAPIMYQCGDPCVVGADYARESDEFAIVVFRLGPLASGQFDPNMTKTDAKGRPLLGNTSWSNVIWAQSWKKMTAAQAAQVFRELRKRYNIIYNPLRGPGFGLDKGGGGSAVRDNLAAPDDPEEQVIFDPNDEDYAHFSGLNDPAKYWPGLHLIKPTNEFNLESTMASKGLLQQQHLYIGYYEPPTRWAKRVGLTNDMGGVDTSNPMYQAIQAGYHGVQRLKNQLIRLQSKVSETSTIRFVMPGKRELDEGKKDLYSAFIYGTYVMRQHIVGLTKGEAKPPAAQPILVNIGSERSRSKKDVRSWTSIKWR